MKQTKQEDPSRDLARLLHEVTRGLGLIKNGDPPLGMKRWIPSARVHEANGAIAIEMDLPGFDKEGVSVSASGELLTITGERAPRISGARKDSGESELHCATFFLCFNLPDSVQANAVRSQFDNGVLTITLRPH